MSQQPRCGTVRAFVPGQIVCNGKIALLGYFDPHCADFAGPSSIVRQGQEVDLMACCEFESSFFALNTHGKFRDLQLGVRQYRLQQSSARVCSINSSSCW